jgi:hypothetical protein
VGTLTVQRLVSFADLLGQDQLLTVNVGPDLEPLLLSVNALPPLPRGKRRVGPFGWLRVRTPYEFAVHWREEGSWHRLALPPTERAYYHVAPLSDGRWLLVEVRAESDSTQNAAVHDAQGRLISTFHAGDGIEWVQTTEAGRIWIGYFDEGIFSRVGLGNAGLACLDAEGQVLFRHDALAEPGGVPPIADCYALNVASDEDVWAYYYKEFPLLRLRRGTVAGMWTNIPVAGASAFGVHGDRVLFVGSHRRKRALHLLTLLEMRAFALTPVDQAGDPLNGTRLRGCGRGPKLYLHTDEALYCVDLRGV